MKRKAIKSLRYTAIVTTAIIAGLVVVMAVNANAETDTQLEQIDAFIEQHETRHNDIAELETVSLSYSEWKAKKAREAESEATEATTEAVELTTEAIDYSAMDVWMLGSTLYGISELDTTRTLKLISYEGYGYSPLSYYVACCCWVRCQEGYFGFSDLYSSFGGADTSYGAWMDDLQIADWAYDALWNCYMNPTYVTSCNGMECPAEYVYAEFDGNNMIYVW